MCSEHTRRQQQAYRKSRQHQLTRDYDSTWRMLRIRFLNEHPLCECDECGGGTLRVTPAEVVDHIAPIATHPELRLVWSNLRAMAKRCHDRHTARTRGWGRGDEQSST